MSTILGTASGGGLQLVSDPSAPRGSADDLPAAETAAEEEIELERHELYLSLEVEMEEKAAHIQRTESDLLDEMTAEYIAQLEEEGMISLEEMRAEHELCLYNEMLLYCEMEEGEEARLEEEAAMMDEIERLERNQRMEDAMARHRSKYDALFAKWSGVSGSWIVVLDDIDTKSMGQQNKDVLNNKVVIVQPNPWGAAGIETTSKQYYTRLNAVFSRRNPNPSDLLEVAADKVFAYVDPSATWLRGSQLQPIMLKCSPPVPQETLGQIWAACATTHKGRLNWTQVVKMLGFLGQVQNGLPPDPVTVFSSPAPTIEGLRLSGVAEVDGSAAGDVAQSTENPAELVSAACTRIALEISGGSVVQFICGQIKGRKRVAQKVISQVGHYEKIRDYARGYFKVKKGYNLVIPMLVEKVLAAPEFEVVRTKNRFSPNHKAEKSAGYRDYQMILQTTGEKWLFEVQVIPEEMLNLKNELGHDDYTEYRFLLEAAQRLEAKKRREITEAEAALEELADLVFALEDPVDGTSFE